MDQPKRPSEKSYSEVMNEWAAQRHLVHGDRSRLLHPPYDAHPVMKAVGYLGRLLVLLNLHGRSKDFNTMISTGLTETLQAEKAATQGATWKFDGLLLVKSMQATGGPQSFFEKMEALNISTRMPFSEVFAKNWILPRVSIQDLSIALRSGGVGAVALPELKGDPEDDVQLPSLPSEAPVPVPVVPKTGAVRGPGPEVLQAGYGISPDFKTLRINLVQTARLNAEWGAGPATAGGVTGMQTDLIRRADGWTISGNGGTFRQGWLDGMTIQKLAVTQDSGKTVIDEVLFTRAGGGKARLTGTMTLGEMPELDAEMKLESVPVQDLLPVTAAGLLTATAEGMVKLSGSVNRSSGIRMDGTLTLGSGRLSGLPVFKALHQLTGEDQYRLLPLRSGTVHFTTSGSAENGGLVIEIKQMDLDCGTVARLKGTFRQEQIRQEQGISKTKPVDQTRVEGLFKIGVPAAVAARLKPAVASRFFKQGEDGWWWMDLKVDSPVTNSLGRGLADELIKTNTAP